MEQTYFHKIIDDNLLKIHNGKQLIFLKTIYDIRDQILKIMDKTSDTTSGVIRLKWFYDNIAKKETTKLDLNNKSREDLKNFLYSLSDSEMELLLNYINSYSPMLGRYSLASLYDEFLSDNAESFKILCESFGISISKKASIIYKSSIFLSVKVLLIKSGWNFSENNKVYKSQLNEIYEIVNKLEFNDSFLLDKYLKFISYPLFQNNFSDSAQNINEVNNINVGLLSLKSIYFRIFRNFIFK